MMRLLASAHPIPDILHTLQSNVELTTLALPNMILNLTPPFKRISEICTLSLHASVTIRLAQIQQSY